MKRCLVVVDYQVDFVSGTLGFPAAVSLEDAIAAKIEAYREQGDTVLFTFDTHDAEYLETQEGTYLPIPHCIRGTEGHGLYGRIADLVQDGDLCLNKPTFGSGALYTHLLDMPYASIELVGVVSNICVLSNAVLARTAQPETPVLVDASCIASNDPALNDAALAVMQSLQVQITNGKPGILEP